jgi:hypothetical protein
LIFPGAKRIQKIMSTPDANAPGWKRALTGLGFVRRGSVLTAVSGGLLLLLSTVGRAGCANPHLPEARSLMEYQSLVFYLALLLGFVMLVSGQLYAALMPVDWRQRWVALACAALSTLALMVMAIQAHPGRLLAMNAPPGGVGGLATAVLSTTAIAASALLVMQVSRALGGGGLSRSAALFGLAMITAAATNAEAASGLLFPHPVHALFAVAVVAVVNVVALAWIYRLLAESEALIREQLEPDSQGEPNPQPAPRTP